MTPLEHMADELKIEKSVFHTGGVHNLSMIIVTKDGVRAFYGDDSLMILNSLTNETVKLPEDTLQ